MGQFSNTASKGPQKENKRLGFRTKLNPDGSVDFQPWSDTGTPETQRQTPSLEKGVLYPIEQAPEGTDLLLWYGDVPSPRPAQRRGITLFHTDTVPTHDTVSTHDFPMIGSCAPTHFTLWPVPAQPKHSWDEYTQESKADFIFDLDGTDHDNEGYGLVSHHDYDGFGPHLCVDKNQISDADRKALRALHEFTGHILNHHYPEKG